MFTMLFNKVRSPSGSYVFYNLFLNQHTVCEQWKSAARNSYTAKTKKTFNLNYTQSVVSSLSLHCYWTCSVLPLYWNIHSSGKITYSAWNFSSIIQERAFSHWSLWSTRTLHAVCLISDAKSFRFFFLLGEVMAVALIIGHKINLAGGTMNSVSNITRNPAKKDIQNKFFVVILLAFALTVLLTSVLVNQFIVVITIFVAFDIILYIILLHRISALQSSVHSAVGNMRRKALLYVSVLLIGFILKIIIAFYTHSLVIDQVDVNCPPVLSPSKVIWMCFFSTRFVWDPTAYFLFNGQPRKMLGQECQKIIRQVKCGKHHDQTERQAAVIPRAP